MVIIDPNFGTNENSHKQHEAGRECPNCGEVTSFEKTKCKFCGWELPDATDAISTENSVRDTNSSISLLLAILSVALWLCIILGLCKSIRWLFKHIEIPMMF